MCYKYAALQMIEQGKGGRIIGASSVAGKQGLSQPSSRISVLSPEPLPLGWGGIACYSSSKFAVRGLTQAVGAFI